MDPPPPPPPHGSNNAQGGPRSGGLPPGNYDIFVIPPHSSGGGFLYLPSLKPERNSFLAGVASTVFVGIIYLLIVPVLRDWFRTLVASGGIGVVFMLLVVGVLGWAWGKTQSEGGIGPDGAGGAGTRKTGPGEGHSNPYSNGHASGGHANGHAPGGDNTHSGWYAGGQSYGQGPQPTSPGGGARPPPKTGWQRTTPEPETASTGAKGAWEKAREETRRKEEERRRNEELRKKADELRAKRERDAKEKQEQREKEAKEKEERELREKREKAAKEAREAREARLKEARETREKDTKERKEREEKENHEKEVKAAKEAAQAKAAKALQDAREAREKLRAQSTTSARQPPLSPRKPHHATARTEADEDAYSYRPYDKAPKPPTHKTGPASSIYSSSYAPSMSTAPTTPPPSRRGPYSTKDPDKIVIRAVYSFNHAFNKVPIAQLVSGEGSVTDGLILRITTEGLFIDDDVRGVPQREWDVKAWTMKLVEVWCPQCQDLGASFGSNGSKAAGAASRSAFFGIKSSSSANKLPSNEETEAFLGTLLPICKTKCSRSASSNASSSSRFSNRFADNVSPWDSASNVGAPQTAEHKGLHVFRASIRDQEGKRYIFVIQEEEAWKVAVGLQRLRRGTQAQALRLCGMPANETKAILENMGWA